MPIIKVVSEKNFKISVWKFDENETDFLLKYWQENSNNKNYSKGKKMEFCMVRALLDIELPNHQILYKEDSSPYLNPQSKKISISHSFPYVCIALSNDPIGVDLEKIRDKIFKIKDKFILKEIDYIKPEFEKEYLNIIWSIKEALYKIHPSNLWSFKKHYFVDKFELNMNEKIHCNIYTDEWVENFEAKYIKFEEIILSWVIKI